MSGASKHFNKIMGRFKGKKKSKANFRQIKENVEYGYIPESFINYYKVQFVPDYFSDDEFNQMIEYFRKPLCHTFRVVNEPHTAHLKSEIDKFTADLSAKNITLEKVNFLNDMFGPIYRLSLDKPSLRRDPSLQEFREWLNLNMKLGTLIRQEIVSMVPPFFLDLKPNYKVLDVAAAPGSKTSQILSIVKEGLLIANDVNVSRCTTLVHNINRLDTENSIVISYPAEYIPIQTFGSIHFDRILCDVPCSGDGTLRKNPDASAKFTIENGPSLHSKQRAILIRAMKLLKIGGRIVYSTCSLNPIEDEAVISSVVKDSNNAIKIVDVSNELPLLKRGKGLKRWNVLSELKEDTMYPDYKFENACDGIENCMRFFPHQNDTGGFFVAVLQKVADTQDIEEPKLPHKPLFNWKEPPYFPLKTVSNDCANELKDSFGLTQEFIDKCFVRDQKIVRNIFYAQGDAGTIVKDVPHADLRAVSCGTRVFTWKEFNDPNAIRAIPCIEGAKVVEKFSTKRRILVCKEDMKLLVKAGNDGVKFQELQCHNEVEKSSIGGIIFHIDGTSISYGGLRMKEKVILYVKKEDIDREVGRIDGECA